MQDVGRPRENGQQVAAADAAHPPAPLSSLVGPLEVIQRCAGKQPMESTTFKRLAIIGAPSSAGAYAPDQEKAPTALRAAGLPGFLTARGITVDDYGDVSGFRWRADKVNPRAMNVNAASTVAKATAERVASALAADAAVLVMGGDCTVELGTVAGA